MQTKVTADPQLQNDGAMLKHRKSQNKDKYKKHSKKDFLIKAVKVKMLSKQKIQKIKHHRQKTIAKIANLQLVKNAMAKKRLR